MPYGVLPDILKEHVQFNMFYAFYIQMETIPYQVTEASRLVQVEEKKNN